MAENVRRADPSSFVPGAMQQFGSPLSTHAVFLVLRVAAAAEALDRVRGVLADLSGTIKAVAFRDPSATLTCTVGIGSEIWPRLVGTPRPSQLRPFAPIVGEAHTAPATAGDLLFHIRADRADICFEFERQLMDALGDAVSTADETACFRYFDRRDVLGFVDGTANPVGEDIADTVLVGDEDKPTPVAEARGMAGALGVEAVVVPGAGHLTAVEAPAAVAAALGDLLGRARG